jgi:hypothetical protein
MNISFPHEHMYTSTNACIHVYATHMITTPLAHMYACTHVCMHTCMHAHLEARTMLSADAVIWMNMRRITYVYMHICIQAHMYTCTHVYTLYTCTHVYKNTCIHTYLEARKMLTAEAVIWMNMRRITYVYIHICIQAHMHTYTP